MKSYTSRLKNFDLGSMSDSIPHAIGIRATVENVVSDYGIGNLLGWVGANPEPVRIDNPISAHFNSISTWTFDFTGRVSIFSVLVNI